MKQTLNKRGLKSRADAIDANSYYCVITPQTPQDLDYLDTTKQLTLLDYPIDYEVIEEGEYYIPNWVTDTMLAPRYAIVDNPKALPQELNVEVKEPLHYPQNEDEAAAYLYNKLAFGLEQLPPDKDTNQYIKENKWGWKPTIKLLFMDHKTNLEPLADMEIFIGNESFQTNSSGEADAKKTHYGSVTIKATFYNYNTGNIVKKGIDEFINFDQKNNIEDIKKNKERVNVVVTNSKKLHNWYKAATYVAIQKYNNYCDKNGIQKALFLNVWVSELFNSSSAPLFRRLNYLNQQSNPSLFLKTFCSW